ncbi:TonB-dependent receptor [Granulicella sibirica]|uniref:Oar protein n=1 Tax=Granulicella sibirica TaxID=2479048 RepID=A0A4Q0SYF2_9BACT|nr:carboxypeptidase regulatory-like domain-containing protein [Granulicella sibirica]RXH56263.1 Oar protein [Granulicella sibirica]
MKMFYRALPFLVVLLSLLVVCPDLRAQQTGISGVVVDVQGGVLQGAKVEVKEMDGSSFFATTNAQGSYVFPSLLAADYTIKVSASGFATVEKRVLLLVGQLAQVDFTLPVASASAVAEVSAGDQLAIDTTSSVVAGNVTPKEVEDVPINGRNYIALSTLIPGIKANAFGNSPVSAPGGASYGDAETGKFQITMDGLQVSQDSVGSSFGQPRFSQDAISQFQIITNRFDATAGRSAGIYVNAQTKTGTNVIHGGGFGYFRNSAFNASDPISKKVNTFADEQYGGTFGGKIKRDKLWYFGSYEGEHSPTTYTASPIIGSAFSHPSTLKVNEWLGRLDYQRNDKNHFLLRGDKFNNTLDFVGAPEPSSSYSSAYSSYGYVFDWDRSINDRLINDVHAGYHHFVFQNLPYYNNNSIVVALPTVTVGEAYNQPETFSQDTQQYRDDLFWLKGKHSVKVGGEYLYTFHGGSFAQYARGGLTSCSSNRATPLGAADYANFFPNGTLDPTTWNYAAIGAYCNTNETFTQGFGSYDISIGRNILGFWGQDDWKILPRLTLNLGLRYDNDLGAYNTSYVPTPGLLTPNTNPNANFAPRIGFSYDPFGDGKTSIRGGAGLYFADQVANAIIDEQLYSSTARALQATISTNQSTGGAALSLPNPFANQNPLANPTNYVSAPQPVARGAKTPYALQMSFGMARELPYRTTMTADFVHSRVYGDFIALSGNLLANPANPQQNLNPATAISAANYATRSCGNGSILLDNVSSLANGGPGGIVAKQVCNNLFGATVRQFTTNPGAGVISDALQVGIKHATTRGFTSAVAYTWGRTKNSTNGAFSYPNKPFASGIQQEWANGTDDQRHTLTLTGEYQWKYGLSLSSLYHFGSGQAFAPATGASVNGYALGTRTFAAQPISPGQTCPVAACVTTYAPLSKVHFDSGYGYWILERDGFRGTPYHRVDSRLQESFKIKEKYHAIVAVEAFNLFNHSNYGNFATTASIGTGANAYGTPLAVTGNPVEYFARSLQFIGRFSF